MRSLSALLLLALPATLSSQILKDPAARTSTGLTLIAAGTPPSSLTATPASTSSISLRWTCPDGASGYDVWATSSTGVQSKLTATPLPPQCLQNLQVAGTLSSSPSYSLTYTHSGLIPASAWTYVVVALYPNGAQGASAPVSGRAGLLPPPGGFHGESRWGGAALAWNYVTWGSGYQVTYSRSYQVFRQRPGEATFSPIGTTDQTFYEDKNLILGQRYNYYVRAIESQATAPISVMVGAPSDPSIVAFCGKETLDFRWGGTESATSAKVLRAGTPGGPWYPTGDYPGNTNSFARAQPNPVGVLQYYKVLATYPAGPAESVVIPITIPADPKAYYNGTYTRPVGSVTIEWQCQR